MKENEKLRNDNKRYQELMKTLQIPPNGVANPAAFFKSKAKSLASKSKGDNAAVVFTKNNAIKPALSNQTTVQVMPTNQNVTILPSTNQITAGGAINQVGTNQIAAGGSGNAILVQNPNGGYFLVPANNLNKNMTTTIPMAGNQVVGSSGAPPTLVVSSQTTTMSAGTGQDTGQIVLGQTAGTSTNTTTVTTQCVTTPIATASQQQAPGMMQTIRYVMPMIPPGQGGANQTQNQTMMVMAKPNQTLPVRIAPQQPIRMAGSQPQMILPQPPGGVPATTASQDSRSGKKKSSPPKIKNLCSSESDLDNRNEPTAIAPAPVQSIAPSVGPNQVVLQRPPVQTTAGGVVGTGNPNMVTMQVVPKPVTQQIVYLQQPNGQLIPVMIQNPQQQGGGAVIQQQGGGQQQVVTMPVNNQGQQVNNTRQIVVVSQAGSAGSTGSTNSTTMTPLSVMTSNNTGGNHRFSNTNDILAKAAESIFSPNSLNDCSPTLSEPSVSAPAAPPSNKLSSVLPPFPVSIKRANDPLEKILQEIGHRESGASMEPTPPAKEDISIPICKKVKKAKKKKKKKEKSKDKDKEKSKSKSKDKSKKHKHKSKSKSDQKEKVNVKTEEAEDNALIKELDRGMANSIDALPDSTSGTAIITDSLLQEWIEKEAGLANPDQDDDDSTGDDTITNVTAAVDQIIKKEDGESDQGQSSTSMMPSNYSAEALLAGGSSDTSQANGSTETEVPPATLGGATTSPSATTDTNTTTATTTNSQNPFGFSFGSDIMSSAMSVSGLPTYIEDDDQSDEGSATPKPGATTNTGLNSLKALGSMRDSILSFGGSSSGSTSQLPHMLAPQQNEQIPSDATVDAVEEDRSKSASPVHSLPMDSPSPNPPARDSSPESVHRFSPSPVNLMPDNLDAKIPTNDEEDLSQNEQSLLPTSHNSSWISHHSRASHLASSGLNKKPKASGPPPVPPSSLPLSVVTTTSSSSTTESPANTTPGPAGFYTLPGCTQPWLSPVTPINSRMTTPTSNTDSTSPVQPMSIPAPTYLPTQRSSSPTYAPSQHVSPASYLPPQRSSSPTYIPSPHQSTSPPSYMPRITTQSTRSTSSPLTVDTNVSHPIFSTSGQLSTPPSRSVITMSQMGSTVTTTHSMAKLKSRPSAKKFSPSTIHRTLTSGITEDSPEKGDEMEAKPEQRPQIKEQMQREWNLHKLPMQVKPGPDISSRTKEGLLLGLNPNTSSGAPSPHAKPAKSKRNRKKKNSGVASGKETIKGEPDGSRGDLDDIGKRELPKNLVVQFPWLAEAEEEAKKKKVKKEKDQKQSDRSKSFSIQRITQPSSVSKANASQGGESVVSEPVNTNSQSTWESQAFGSSVTHQESQNKAPSTHRGAQDSTSSSLRANQDPQSRVPVNHESQSHTSPTSQQFWNPSTSDSYSKTAESFTSTNKQTSDVDSNQFASKSRIEYTPKQIPSIPGMNMSRQSPAVVASSSQSPTYTASVSVTSQSTSYTHNLNMARESPSYSPSVSVSSQSPSYSPSAGNPTPLHHSDKIMSNNQTLPNFNTSTNQRDSMHQSRSDSFANENQSSSASGRGRKTAAQRKQYFNTSSNEKSSTSSHQQQSDLTSSPLNSPADSSSLFTEFHLAPSLGINPNVIPPSSTAMDNRMPSMSPSQPQKQDTAGSRMPPVAHEQPTRSSAAVLPDNFLFSPTTTSSTSNNTISNQSSVFATPTTNRNQAENDDFMSFAQADKSLDFLSNSPDQSQNVESLDDLSSLPLFDTPTSTPASTQSSMQGSTQSRLQQHPQHQQAQHSNAQQPHRQPVSGRASADRHQQPPQPYGQSPSHQSTNMRSTTTTPHQMYSMQQQNTGHLEGSQVMSPHQPVMSPHQPVMSPHQPVMSPHQPVMSPHAPVMSPHAPSTSQHAPSPHAHTAPPHAHTAPTHAHTAPTHALTAPTHAHSAPTHAHTAPTRAHTTPSVSQQNRFPDMQQQQHPGHHGGTKRPSSESSHPTPNPKRAAIMQHHQQQQQQLALPPHIQHDMQQQRGSSSGVVLERPPGQVSAVHRTEHTMHRGKTPPSTASQQVGSPHGPQQHHQQQQQQQQQHLQRSIERQMSASDMQHRVPTYNLNQSVAHQRNRTSDIVAASSRGADLSRSNSSHMPMYDLTQSVGPQRNRSTERPPSASDSASAHRMSSYELIQSASAQRTRSTERQSSETQRVPTYDLTQSAGIQRTHSMERPPSGSEPLRSGGGAPVYNLSQNASGTHRNPVERQTSRSESSQRIPTYDLSQSAGAQRGRSMARTTSSSSSLESQRIPTYDLTQSPHRDHHVAAAPPKQRTKRQAQNNSEQYFPSTNNTSSLRHMDSSIAQESNPWSSGFPPTASQRGGTEPSLSSPPFLPNFAPSVSQSHSSSSASMSQSESVPSSSSSGSIVPSLSPSSRRLRNDMPTYHHLPHPHLSLLPSPPQASKSSIGREAEISTPFNPMFQPAHTRAGLAAMNVPPNFPPVFHEHHQHAPPAPFNVGKSQLPGNVGVHPTFNFSNIFNDMPNTSHADSLPVHAAMHLHGNPGMSVEDSMAHMRASNVQSRHVHGHPQAFANNMLLPNVTADGRTFKVGVPMGAPFHAASFGTGMPF